jgi:hypothetical protein
MKKANFLYHCHRFPAVVISNAVRRYFRFSLNLRKHLGSVSRSRTKQSGAARTWPHLAFK